VLRFREVWVVDCEFSAPPGERPDVRCLVAHELNSGRRLRLWRNELGARPPYDIGADSIFVSYFAPAELGCHLALGWPMPENVLDLFTEFRVQTNGLSVHNNLLSALVHFGLPHMDGGVKEDMRQLALRDGPYTEEEKRALLDYCEEDVVALERLLPALLPQIPLSLAHLRGRYMRSVAAMIHYGVPIDVTTLDRFNDEWENIKLRLIESVDAGYGVYKDGVFKQDLFEQFLIRLNRAWPRTLCGRLETSRDAFRDASKIYPDLLPLYELRVTMDELKLHKLAVGKDGRNRTMLSPFGTKTGRNAPSTTEFIFGPARWIRGLILPPPGYGVAYIDWSAQELAIAAALSGDANMIAAYHSGDFYTSFGKMAGVIPLDADKSHPAREQFKVVSLAVMYGAGAERVAAQLNLSEAAGRELIAHHKNTFPQFWHWRQAVADGAQLTRHIHTVYGFDLRLGPKVRPTTVLNFPMQANGAEMLRLACVLGTEAGIEIVAPVHDAVLIAAPLERLEQDVVMMQELMRKAGAHVLKGFDLRTEAKIVRYPDRYMDERGAPMWAKVMGLLKR
jgi:DNA polymerase-1